ncbi:YdcF family protein [bacterium SCSIO 12741]|nr:YdcF family protein [bacterium SCSIO 12741]
MKKRFRLRRILLTLLLLLIGTGSTIYFADQWVSSKAKHCYSSTDDLPKKKVGLLLGAGKYTRKGNINPYYKNRVEAAVKLYRSGKIKYLLVSGDNSSKSYDEPSTFLNDLKTRGIPESRIVLDYAGFRTLDSVERCEKVFGESDIIIISQPFHNERALFIAHHKGMNAVAYNARRVSRSQSTKTMLREKLARVKTLLDLFILQTEPKFYGKPIKIG